MLKTALGFALAFALGAAGRWIDIPVPAPNKLIGALLVLAVTLGYLAADSVLPSSAAATGAASSETPLAQKETRGDQKADAGE